MKKVFLIILISFLFSCDNNKTEMISLAEIDLKKLHQNDSCKESLKWINPDYYKGFIDSLKEINNDNYKKVVLVKFSHSGEVVEYNSIAILYSESNEVLILYFGIDYTVITKKISVPAFPLSKFLSKIPEYGGFTQMHILEITDKKTNCYFKEGFSYEKYKALQDLSFFENL